MRRGSKPGERRGGRQKGTPNKVTADLQEAAQVYTPAALKTLNDICVGGESEAARVAAANSLLDRGYGKPTAHVTGDLTHKPGKVHSEPISETLAWIQRTLAEFDQREESMPANGGKAMTGRMISSRGEGPPLPFSPQYARAYFAAIG